MSNMRLCDTRRELIGQVMMGAIDDDTIAEALPVSFYNAIRAAVTVACVVQFIPMGKSFEKKVGYSPATINGILLFLQVLLESDAKEIIRNELIEIMNGEVIDPYLALYFNDQFVDSIEYLSELVQKNKLECEQIILTVKYLQTRIEEVEKSLNIVSKYDS